VTREDVPSSDAAADRPAKGPKAPVERRIGDDRSGRVWRSIVVRAVSGGLRSTGASMRTFGEPPAPGCVVAFHHNSPIDALVLGLQAWRKGHHPIAMVHADIFRAPVVGHIVTRAGMVAVEREDRADRKAAYRHSLDQLAAGHTVFIAPESGISRSFTLQDVRHGATRLAIDAGVPLVPAVTFGTQRLGGSHSQPFKPRRGVPMDVYWGDPLTVDDVEATTQRLEKTLDAMLTEALAEYPEPGPGQWWWPQHLGGSAPTPQQAADAKRSRLGDDDGG
jgi:1-acyl-sn-glycerol-3-phosphate acyltransferase